MVGGRGVRPKWTAICTVFTTAALVGLASSVANSLPVTDQLQPQFNATTGFQTGHTDLAQTFTVGITGQLVSIQIIAANGGPLMLDLLQTSGGLPTSTVLASAVAGSSGSPAWTTFDFSSSNITVMMGELLAFQPIATGSNGQVVGLELTGTGDGSIPVAPDPYLGGAMFYRQFPCPGMSCSPPTGGAWVSFSALNPESFKDADMAFVTTVSPTPIPASLFLFATGLGLMGLFHGRASLRRRR